MNKFTKEILDYIRSKKILFGAKNGAYKYVFSRVPSMIDCVDIIMAGEVEQNGLIRVMTPLCYVIGSEPYCFSYICGLDDEFLEQKKAEYKTLCNEVRAAIRDRVIHALDKRSDKELVPDSEKREACLANLKGQVYENILSNEEPSFDFLDDVRYCNNESVLRYLCDREKFIDQKVKRFLKDGGILGFSFLARSFVSYRAKLAFFKNYQKNTNDLAASRIFHVLEDLEKSGASYVRMHVDGRNEMVNEQFRNRTYFNPWDIDGKDLSIRAPVRVPITPEGQLNGYFLKVMNYNILSKSDGKFSEFLNNVDAKDVKKITYHGKVVYSRLSEAPKINPRKK